MFVVEHLESNTLYCVHGRHGTQSMRRLALSNPGCKMLSQRDIRDSDVMSDHYRGKIRAITRDPMEKFQSGLGWYLDRIETVSTGPGTEIMWNNDITKSLNTYAIKTIIHAMIVASSTSSTFENLCLDRTMKQNKDLATRFDIYQQNHFRYHLGESHLSFSNLSMVLLVGLGLDVEIFDITNINQIYAEFGFVDKGVNAEGKYVMSEGKGQYYSDIMEHYLDGLESLTQDDWFNKYYQPSKQEFNDLMSWEYRAYNALNSVNMVEDCKSIILDLLKGILDPKSNIEISYLIHSMNDNSIVAEFFNVIPYKSELYPAVGLLTGFMTGFVAIHWNDCLQDCKNLLQ